MALEGLNLEWERNDIIRRRFQKGQSWLQWPTIEKPKKSADDGSDDEESDKHPICTKSLEMNVDAVIIMTNFLGGSFGYLDPLKKEAISSSTFVRVWHL